MKMPGLEQAYAHINTFRFHLCKATTRDGQYVAALRDLRVLRAGIRDLEESIVADMRADGWGWAEVGDALGVSRQAARQRYGA